MKSLKVFDDIRDSTHYHMMVMLMVLLGTGLLKTLLSRRPLCCFSSPMFASLLHLPSQTKPATRVGQPKPCPICHGMKTITPRSTSLRSVYRGLN